MQQQMHDGKRKKARAQIIHHDTGAFGQPLQQADGRRLQDIEDTEKYKAREERFPSERDGDEGDQLASDLVYDDELRIFQAGCAFDLRGGGDSD
jgi:hypothetical protein